MSDSEKARMVSRAYAKTGGDYRRQVLRLMATTDCPAVSVFACSGGPSTETTFVCNFRLPVSQPGGLVLAGWHPHCTSAFPGQFRHCPLRAWLRQRFLNARSGGNAETLALINRSLYDLSQLSGAARYFRACADGAVGWREVISDKVSWRYSYTVL